MKQTVQYSIVIVLAVVAIVAMLKFSAHTDAVLMEISDCVVKTAQDQGYPGNPYSQEAWNLFASECK